MNNQNTDKISYHYVYPTAATVFTEDNSVTVIIFGNGDAESLRALILDILKNNPTMLHYVEARESDSKIIELLRAEKFEEGEVFLRKHMPGAGWYGYVIAPHIVNSW